MSDVTFHSPATLDEAFALMKEHGDDARLIAGGTALVVMMKQSLVVVDHLVSLASIPGLSGIAFRNGELHIGALTRHRDVEESPVVREHLPFLADVYGRVATVRIRNAATVGGGLAHADPSQDPPAAFMVLDARVRAVSPRGEREIAVSDLFRDYYETALRSDEVLAEVIVPVPSSTARTTYLKFLPRTEDDYATVAVGALAEVAGGVCQKLRVTLVAAGPTPVRAEAVEAALEGQPVTADAIREAAKLVAEAVDPIEDFRGSSEYKRDMAVVFTRRALEQVLLGAVQG
ncbi:MAG: xanthine dehydrogenase family protein subunit M [Chloroflexota bacterium]